MLSLMRLDLRSRNLYSSLWLSPILLVSWVWNGNTLDGESTWMLLQSSSIVPLLILVLISSSALCTIVHFTRITDSLWSFVIISRSGKLSRENFIWNISPSSLRSIKTKSPWSRIDAIRPVSCTTLPKNDWSISLSI